MPTFTTRAGLTAAPLFPALVDLYATVYAQPPYNEGPEQTARFRDGLPAESRRPGFTLIAAEDTTGLVGAAHGWTMPAGMWWRCADQEPPAQLRDVDKLAVMEWIVRPDRRGQGVGAELMRRLLADRPEPWATLAANPQAPAHGMYLRNGWRRVAGSRLDWGPRMDLLVLRLRHGVESR